MTAADPSGRCWCLRKIRGRSDNPPLVRRYPPFLGRRVVILTGIARGRPVGSVGTMLGRSQRPEGHIRGFRAEGRSCRCCGNSLGGGLTLRRLLCIITAMRESYVEGTTLTGGLLPYVSNGLHGFHWMNLFLEFIVGSHFVGQIPCISTAYIHSLILSEYQSSVYHDIPCHIIPLKYHGNNITSMAFHRSPLHSTWMPYNSIEMPWKSMETINTNQSQGRGPAAPGWYNVSCRDRWYRIGHHRHDEWSRCDSHEW